MRFPAALALPLRQLISAKVRILLAASLAISLSFGLAVNPLSPEPASAAGFNLTIANSSNSNVSFASGVYTATADPAVISVTDLVNELSNGSVTVVASGNIAVAADVVSATSSSLTLKAEGNIVVNNGVRISLNGGDLTLQADSAAVALGSIRLGALNNTTGSLETNGGDITLSGGSDPTTGYAYASADIQTSKPSAGVAVYGFTLDAAGGNILVRGSSNRSGTERTRGVFLDESGGGLPKLLTSGAGAVSIFGVGSSQSSGSTSSWAINIRAGQIVSGSGGVIIDGFLDNPNGTVNRRGIAAEGSFSATSTSGDIVLRDRTVVTGHLDSYYASTSSLSTTGNIRIFGNKILNTGTLVLDATEATIESYTAPSFTSNLVLGRVTANDAEELIVGRVGNLANVTVNFPITVGGPTRIEGDSVYVNAKLEVPAHELQLHATTEVTQTGEIVAQELSLHGTADFTLMNLNNNVAKLAAGSQANPVGSVLFTDKQDNLAIDQVGSLSGISSNGAINVYTTNGDLEVTKPVKSTQSTGDSVQLAASSSSLVDDLGDGQLKISGTGAIDVESGARALLYTGGAQESTGLLDLIGSSNFRDRVDINTVLANLTSPPSSTGRFALFRITAVLGSSPTPYTGPVLSEFSSRTLDPCTPKSITITGTRLSGVTASIQGKSVTVLENTDTKLVLAFPAGLTPGSGVDLAINSSSGKLTFQDAFDIPANTCSLELSKGRWTQLQPDGKTVKMYAKDPVGDGKIQFFVDGKEIAWINAVDLSDPKLSFASTNPYLVRSVELKPGKNRFEIKLDGVRVWRATYVPKG